MTDEKSLELVNQLYNLSMAQHGQIIALKTVCEALLSTLSVNFPPLVSQFSKHIDGLAPFAENSLEESSIDSFRANIDSIKENLRVLQGL